VSCFAQILLLEPHILDPRKEPVPSGLKAKDMKTPEWAGVWPISGVVSSGGLESASNQALGGHLLVDQDQRSAREDIRDTSRMLLSPAVAKASRWRTCVTAKERRLRNEEGILADCGGPDWF
jgi:hypothetical protein